MIRYKILIITLLIFGNCISQTPTKTAVTQPKILVVPYVKTGGNIMAAYEADDNKGYRDVLIAITGALEDEGCKVVVLKNAIDKAKNRIASKKLKGQKIDYDAEIVNAFPCDVLIRAEVQIVPQSMGNIMTIKLQAVDAVTSSSMGSYSFDQSPEYASTAPPGTIAKKVLSLRGQLKNIFLPKMNAKFSDMVENGRSISLEIIQNSNTVYGLDTELGANGDYLSDLITEWIADNAYKNNYAPPLDEDNALIFEEIRIPVLYNGRNYSAAQFGKKLRRYIVKMIRQSNPSAPNLKEKIKTNGVITLQLK